METYPRDIALHIEKAAATDWVNSCLAAPPEVVAMTGLGVKRFGAAFAVTMPMQKDYPVNGTNGVGILEPASEPLLRELIAHFREVDRNFGIGVTPVSQPTAMREMLLDCGFIKGGHIPILYRSTLNLPEIKTEFCIERIGAERAEIWASVFGQMFVPYLTNWMAGLAGQPGRFHYVVFDGEMPVAVSQMSLTNSVAFPHFTAVLPSHRGRGLQRALIAQRICDAAEAGCDWLCSTADEDTPDNPGYSMHNLLHSGFQLLHLSEGYDFQIVKT